MLVFLVFCCNYAVCGSELALRVTPAVTRLTVYRWLHIMRPGRKAGPCGPKLCVANAGSNEMCSGSNCQISTKLSAITNQVLGQVSIQVACLLLSQVWSTGEGMVLFGDEDSFFQQQNNTRTRETSQSLEKNTHLQDSAALRVSSGGNQVDS